MDAATTSIGRYITAKAKQQCIGLHGIRNYVTSTEKGCFEGCMFITLSGMTN